MWCWQSGVGGNAVVLRLKWTGLSDVGSLVLFGQDSALTSPAVNLLCSAFTLMPLCLSANPRLLLSTKCLQLVCRVGAAEHWKCIFSCSRKCSKKTLIQIYTQGHWVFCAKMKALNIIEHTILFTLFLSRLWSKIIEDLLCNSVLLLLFVKRSASF